MSFGRRDVTRNDFGSRRKVSRSGRGRDRRSFSSTAGNSHVHNANVKSRPMRGGIRL